MGRYTPSLARPLTFFDAPGFLPPRIPQANTMKDGPFFQSVADLINPGPTEQFASKMSGLPSPSTSATSIVIHLPHRAAATVCGMNCPSPLFSR